MPLFLMQLVWFLLCAVSRSRRALVLENLALRQQLAVLARSERRPPITPLDRLFWVGLRRWWAQWQGALAIVQPDTVVAWHRALFRGYWRFVSRRRRGRPRTEGELRALIRQMATENRWGAPRIHGELLKLGWRVSERTVSRYLRQLAPRRGGNWKAFLRNHRHAIVAMDFVVVPTVTFRLLYVLVILHHNRRRVLHVNVTAHPTAAWVCQQLRAAFPEEPGAKYLLLDHDSIFSKRVVATAQAIGLQALRTGFQSPWLNGVCERCIGNARRELLDRVLVFNERHLLRLMKSYVRYYNADRTSLAVHKDAPDHRPVTPRPSPGTKVVAIPRLGGLHHRYAWRDAA